MRASAAAILVYSWCTRAIGERMELHLGFSVYTQSLPDGAKKRYKEKIIHGLDPFGSGLGEAIPDPTVPPV